MCIFQVLKTKIMTSVNQIEKWFLKWLLALDYFSVQIMRQQVNHPKHQNA